MPARMIAGQKSLLGRDMHDIRYDAIHDEVFVTNARAQAIMVFRGGAAGEEPPIRVISGPHTQIAGNEDNAGSFEHLDVDPVHNEIFVPAGDSVLVFPRDAQGDVAPLRVLRGPDTQLMHLLSLVVDPVHDLLIAGIRHHSPWEKIDGTIGKRHSPKPDTGSLLIFNRTDSGNVKPRAIIGGPKSGLTSGINQMLVYPPKGWILLTGQEVIVAGKKYSSVSIWSISDNGDVPPRWTIGGPKAGIKLPRGVALDPKHKELFVADGGVGVNGLMTYYLPEIF